MLEQYTPLSTPGLVDLSARPDAPVRPGRRARSTRATRPAPSTRQARAGLAAGLRRLAAALEPRPTTERNRATAAPVCQ